MARAKKTKGDKEDRPRILKAGTPDLDRCDNKVSTAKYTLWSFLPVAVVEQFRRVANMYFLIMGCIMAIGYYSDLFESAISPFTTLGPLAFVVSISLTQEGLADLNRHRSDSNTNNAPCVILNRSDEVESENREPSVLHGKEISVNLDRQYFAVGEHPPSPDAASNTPSKKVEIVYERIRRMDIRQGHLVLIRNRDMVPADLVLLASSSDNGNAYIETSSIDGETNLKLRTSPQLPKEVLKKNRDLSLARIDEHSDPEDKVIRESLPTATKRVVRFSSLAFPDALSALENHENAMADDGSWVELPARRPSSGLNLVGRAGSIASLVKENFSGAPSEPGTSNIVTTRVGVPYVAALKCEPPNASVNTFNGTLTLPPVGEGEASVVIPVNADNVLLRGAVLRNTEWAIGLSVYTGVDTKLVRNSFETPSKFSQLDILMNKVVVYIICMMVIIISMLAAASVTAINNRFDQLWYLGFVDDKSQKWPYLPDLEAPAWETSYDNWVQVFFLFVTLLNNLVPLSLYVTVEIVTAALRIFINFDIDMYHPETDTRTVARSTTVTDLGQVQYVFSDKTGTLTQNVMRFKRCSVDGNVFGAPVAKANPDAPPSSTSMFHPLKRLLTGKIAVNSGEDHSHLHKRASFGLEGLGASAAPDTPTRDTMVPTHDTISGPSKNLTFNSEMFLRVMALCHTVVVEKDFDKSRGVIKSSTTVGSDKKGVGASIHGVLKSLMKRDTSPDEEIVEKPADEEAPAQEEPTKADSPPTGEKGKDGAPYGFAYQAESPDEGALVEAASLKFGFQVVGRDSSGIKLSCDSPSLLSNETIVDGFKDGTLSSKAVAAETASPSSDDRFTVVDDEDGIRHETWQILAINKFDSTRKRMSCLVRSPAELGGIPMLLCKGADTAMLDPTVVDGGEYLMEGNESQAEIDRKSQVMLTPIAKVDRKRSVSVSHDEEEDWQRSMLLGIQAHLSDFAREGLRTLVLGIRILNEEECQSWLKKYNDAAAAIHNRDERLTDAAASIESQLHIVGATAIEDKLQEGVPETIAKLGEAGIKLWVLTGDKRETAKEIGYATKVLTEKMRPGLIEVAKAPEDEVRTRMAMEFMKLVKYAKLPDYQRAIVDKEGISGRRMEEFYFQLGKCQRALNRMMRRLYHKYIKVCFQFIMSKVDTENNPLQEIKQEAEAEKEIMRVTERRKGVRNRAEQIVRAYRDTLVKEAERTGAPPPPKMEDMDLNMGQDGAVIDVFSRGQSARAVIEKRRSQGIVSASDLRGLTLANVTAHNVAAVGSWEVPLVDEEVLSMRSMLPKDNEAGKEDYNKTKRTLLEKIFAADRGVRHGRLIKHLNDDKLETIQQGKPLYPLTEETEGPVSLEGPRALVIEGAALEKLLGDPQLEEILFAVANTCDSVIACRVSPAQKAQLVQLVRRYVVPEPVTLAIGDGANDVGMIQEAHVGVGISGKEGQQAVNASDFAIAQFRFLEPLVLIHGRWSFLRQSTVVLFSFYKNAVMAGCLIVYSGENLYSGTPLFDDWIIAMLNFVAGIPIGTLGLFDRNLDKAYVLKNPEVYGPTRTNEVITGRYLIRWVILCFSHIFLIYYLTLFPLGTDGGGYTSAFDGLMGNENDEAPGDGEGGDVKTIGVVAFTCLIFLLAYKVVLESKSIIIGNWPACTCKSKEDGSTWLDRAGYTWIGNAYFSIGFYMFSIYIYNAIGRAGPSTLSYFVNTVTHALQMRSVSWMLIILVPIVAIVLDIAAKVFANLFFPTQNQIHIERFALGENSKRVPPSPYGAEYVRGEQSSPFPSTPSSERELEA